MPAESTGAGGEAGKGRTPGGAGSRSTPRERRVADVLAATIESMDAPADRGIWEASLTPDDQQRLVGVALRHDRSAPLDVVLAADLVAAVMPKSLAAMAAGPDGGRRLVERIARSLLDDPVSRGRLESLWAAVRAEAAAGPGASES